ncbi:DUF5682 family protein [Micromonospora sp. R77]|uniref:DUF5682 family protein n=1 Tax=Micromonospora sp. R77 TaxID=2925836 RepID=UPI0035B03866
MGRRGVGPDTRRQLHRLLGGLLTAAHPLPQSAPAALDPLLERIERLTDADFLDRLPALRGGFDVLTPAARDRMLHTVTDRLGDRLDLALSAPPDLLARWAAADAAGRSALVTRGIPCPTRRPTPPTPRPAPHPDRTPRPAGSRPPTGGDCCSAGNPTSCPPTPAATPAPWTSCTGRAGARAPPTSVRRPVAAARRPPSRPPANGPTNSRRSSAPASARRSSPGRSRTAAATC